MLKQFKGPVQAQIMYIKFKDISNSYLRKNILMKGIAAKLSDVEEKTMTNGEKYGTFLLNQGNSKIVALAYGDTYIQVKSALKKNVLIKFQPQTFSCKLRDRKYNSNSTCKYDLTFQSNSEFLTKNTSAACTSKSSTMNIENNEFSTLRKVHQLLRTSQTFTRKLNSIKLNGGEVYRYLGCKTCNTSIPFKHSDGKYYCKGMCNNKKPRRSRIGVATERKICMMARDVQLSDENNEVIESVVIYNSVCEILLKKIGSAFHSDNDAIRVWNEQITNNRYDITVKRNKKKRESLYPPALCVHMVDKVTESAVINSADLNTKSELSTDAKGYTDTEATPDFLTYEMKLQPTSQRYKDWKLNYQIASKPPGLVLLINNYNFPYDEKEKVRYGSEIDMKSLEGGFREMGYEIFRDQCQLDIKTRAEFSQLLTVFKDELIEKKVDSSIIVISSHGFNFQVSLPGQSNDSICVIKEMLIPFSDENFPEFQGKPKLFMPITCQNIGALQIGIEEKLDFSGCKLFDMMVCFPCFPGYAQWRFYEHGSLFVNYLMANLMKHAKSWHLTQILEKVQDELKQQIEEKNLKMSIPYYVPSVFRQLYLVPKAGLSNEIHNEFEAMEVDD